MTMNELNPMENKSVDQFKDSFFPTTEEFSTSIKVVKDTPNEIIYQLPNGDYERKQKYKKIATSIPNTDEELLLLFNVFNGSESAPVIPMKEAINDEIIVKNFYTEPYEKFNTETGMFDFGVVTAIESVDGVFFVTSSKSVYFSLLNMYEVFGASIKDKPIKLKITSKKMMNGNQINVELIGFA